MSGCFECRFSYPGCYHCNPEEKNEREDNQFIHYITVYADKSHKYACDKGFWDEERNDGELIALMHSELSEALEALRHGNEPSEHIPEFLGIEEELADTVLRILDFAAARNLKLGEAIIAKMEFNNNRPSKHGKKF